MTTRADIRRLSDSAARVIELAQRDLQQLMLSMDLSSPELVRDALLEVVPIITREYGEIAAIAAADWYEAVRLGAGVSGSHSLVLSPGVGGSTVTGNVRWAAGKLFEPDPMQILGLLTMSLERFIHYSTRDTIRRNAASDSARPRYARVPSGAETCAFCLMMASRGFVYHSREAAGDPAFESFHGDCDCEIVVEFDADQHHIEGYDPDRYYDMYMSARNAAGSGDPKDILAYMRRMYADSLTDGVSAD